MLIRGLQHADIKSEWERKYGRTGHVLTAYLFITMFTRFT